ncbi:protein AATF-like [Acyrthosiphon pisum]|uniref:ACYPI003817 protein n=1 Tax=Acyrthosiphon pisum TaxID=7029 RepID=C4WT73_ACYPI|nr:protein AATF-like [Acyrthosiphon pisum]BAH71093.1 ACYPI003817 [Acyrthosiphon pisum]|eukprot:NP_001280458.1 protein AATF-like [Acyrthosiphon pisum]
MSSSDEEISSNDEMDSGEEMVSNDEIDSEEFGSDIEMKSGEEFGSDDEENYSDNGSSTQGIAEPMTDMEKAKVVIAHKEFYDNLLLLRIKLQKCLSLANTLPQDLDKITKEDKEECAYDTVKDLEQYLTMVVKYQTDLLAKNQNVKMIDKDKATMLTNKLNHKDFEHVLQAHHESFKPYRDETIQFWNERTKLASGKAAKSDFSAFDQPTLLQIDQIMADKTRLIERTQIKRSKYCIVGNPESINTDVDQEIFDDDDFYHKLLRDYIENKTADITDSFQLGKQWLQLQKLRSKMKRKVDTRSTKGRKLRYTVHTKLMNFMAPNDQSSWFDEAKQDLYNFLFGKKNTG